MHCNITEKLLTYVLTRSVNRSVDSAVVIACNAYTYMNIVWSRYCEF